MGMSKYYRAVNNRDVIIESRAFVHTSGPITRSKTKKLKEASNELIQMSCMDPFLLLR